jgi:hypothetical protein
VVAVDVGQEEARGRRTTGVFEEALEAALQTRGLPAPEFGQPAQPVAGFATPDRAGLVAGQAALQAMDDVGVARHGGG